MARRIARQRLLSPPGPGWWSSRGAACLAGARAAQGEILAFIDADGSFLPQELPSLVAPILKNRADLVLGSRVLGASGSRAILPHQRCGNWLAVQLLRKLYGLWVSDLGPYRVVRREMLLSLDMREMTYGWPIEMMIKAAQTGYRIVEVPVSYRPRLAGSSKVSGTLRGSLLAGQRILATVLRNVRRGRAARTRNAGKESPRDVA